ncbi:MAG: hypothetical protein JWR26_2978 [Pedosphaera sp.]|nr:hypothetical protein [Pedosphaera sp.]
MNKFLATTLSLTVLITTAASSYGQGRVQFQNNTALSPVVYSYGLYAGQRIFGPAGTYEFGLYVGAPGATTLSQMILIDTAQNLASTSSTDPFAGLISGGTVIGQGNVGAAHGFAGLVNGTTYSTMVAVWTKADGSDFFTAASSSDPFGYLGLSGLGYFTATQSPTPVAQLFGSGPGQLGTIPEFIPEPTTMTLGALGAAALFLARRRKK